MCIDVYRSFVSGKIIVFLCFILYYVTGDRFTLHISYDQLSLFQNKRLEEAMNNYLLNKSKCILRMVYFRSFGSKLPINLAGLQDSVYVRCFLYI